MTSADLSDVRLTRRRALRAAAGSAATLGLAACGGSDDGDAGSASTRGSTGSGTGGTGSSGGGTPGPLVALADVPVGGAVSATSADGAPVIIAQPTEGNVAGFSAICTHMGCTVAPSGGELHCPCHGSVYRSATGENVTGPAPRPLAPFPVHVDGDQVLPG